MRKPGLVLLYLLAGLSLCITTAWADSSSIKEMARIVENVNHRVADADKDVLRRIVSDESATRGEQAIANALLQLNHQVTPADRDKLAGIRDDSAASPAEQELADIVMGLDHKPSGKDKERLGKL
ncbi:MAG: hypothetical protein RBT81_08165 [Gammaproteobacteria bacterium]|jgi:hypothetical protein|nr:hypothetical protein [Gammaproteobacteria bacterium]